MRDTAPEKRRAPRTAVLGHVQIVTREGGINCVVRDLSDTGAKLGISRRAKLPDEFVLWFVRRNVKLKARLRWRDGDYAGVSFSGTESLQTRSRPRAAKSQKHILEA
jgi:hypothetical protein